MTNLNDVGPACGCLPRLSRIASGILVERHGLTVDEARGAVRRSAEGQNATVHVISRNIMDSVTTCPAYARDND